MHRPSECIIYQLVAGNLYFLVSTTDSFGNWLENSTALEIVIEAPWWRSKYCQHNICPSCMLRFCDFYRIIQPQAEKSL